MCGRESRESFSPSIHPSFRTATVKMKRKTGAAAAANPHGHLQEILRRAYIDCAERGLLQSAKW